MDICSKLITIWGLIITALGVVFMVLFFIGFDAIWLFLQSMNEGTGAMLGSFFGLLVILVGAFLNAELNRNRDDRLLANERASIAAALKSEVEFIALSCQIKGSLIQTKLEDHLKDERDDSAHFLKDHLPPFARYVIFDSISHKIGLFGIEASSEISHLYNAVYEYDAICRNLKI